MTETIQIRQKQLSSRRLASWNVPQSVKNELARFVDELELGKVNRGKKISVARQTKYLDVLRVPLQFFCKPTASLTLKDVESFERALTTDKIKSHARGKPYSYNSKIDIRKALKVFLRWRLGASKALRLVGWLDTRERLKTPDYLKEQEVDRLYRKCRTAVQRFIVAVLFDTGARASEFINIRFEDVQLPEGKDNFVRIALKEEYSKTKGRTVSLYWRHSLEAVKEFLAERVAQGIKSIDPVFDSTYDAMRMFLHRLGTEVLERSIHPHLFRHSSATYYATRLNRQELCYRYGWRFSSNMPDIYISRSGMENKDLDQKFTNTELSGLKDELVKVNQEAKMKDETIKRLQSMVETLQQNVHAIHQIMERKPTASQVTSAIRRKKSRDKSSTGSR